MSVPPFHTRLGCSTISFRHQELPQALATIAGLGFTEIDLGALPGVCDHVPYVLDNDAVESVAATVAASGLTVRSINCDIGDLNVVLGRQGRSTRDAHLARLVALATATRARALVLPCGALDHTPLDTLEHDLDVVSAELAAATYEAAYRGVELWTESLHFYRLCHNIDRAQALADRLNDQIGIVMDFSHIVASGANPVDFVARFGARIKHVHIRDAVPGNINLSVGNGQVDFVGGLKALTEIAYPGHFSLELETRDITNDERPDVTARTARYITELL